MSENQMLSRAYNVAKELHYGQKRKFTGIPYINHPLAVYTLLCEWGISHDHVLAAALLHDCMEDNHKGESIISEQFPTRVYSLVGELTLDRCDKPFDKERQLSAYAVKGEKSLEAIVIKSADRICNTVDFASSSSSNTIDYWNKGCYIRSGIYNNIADLENMFGEECVSNIIQTFVLVKRMLGEFNSFRYLNNNIIDMMSNTEHHKPILDSNSNAEG